MLTPAHIGKERYARTRVPGTPQGHHRHGRAKWYEGTNKGEQKNHRGEAQHTKKKQKKTKKKYVACHATLRNGHETRTATTPTKVKGDHEA